MCISVYASNGLDLTDNLEQNGKNSQRLSEKGDFLKRLVIFTMSEPQDSAAVWYFTRHEQKQGPVTLAVLQQAVAHAKIDTTRDLVWGPGLDAWTKVSEVAALRECVAKAPPAVPEEKPVTNAKKPAQTESPVAKEQPASTEPYTTPKSKPQSELPATESSQYGGMGRLVFFFSPILLVAVMYAVFYLLVEYLTVVTQDMGLMVLGGVLVLLCFLILFARLKNLAMSRAHVLWFGLAGVLPYVEDSWVLLAVVGAFYSISLLWLNYRLYVCPEGYAEHRKLDKTGKILCAVYVTLIVVNVAVNIFYYQELVQSLPASYSS